MIAVLAISGCSDMSPKVERSEPVPGQIYRPSELRPGAAMNTRPYQAALDNFNGAVAGDDPRSVQIGRDMLAAGGTAADAAVAMYFTLAATRPSAAGLGAAGACLVYDWKANALKAYDFAAPVAAPAAGNRRTMAPLMAPRGMFAVHGAHGRLRWAQLVSPGENLARFGTPVSHALAQDLRAAEAGLMRDGQTARIYGTPANRVLTQGQTLMQPELAEMLGVVRQGGPGPLHVGPQARRIAEAAAQAGFATIEGNALPQVFDGLSLPLGDHRISFMPTYDTRGPYQAMLWALLTLKDRIEDAPVGERLHMIADADARAEADYASVLPAGRARLAGGDQLARAAGMLAGYSPDRAAAIPQPGVRRVDESGTSIAAVDKEGQAVACGFTLYQPFGMGRVLPGTGFFPAVAPTPDLDSAALSPTIVWNNNTKQVFFAGAGSGVAAATGVVITALQTVLGKFELETGMGIPRLHHPGTPNLVLIEKSVGEDARGDLSKRGYQMQEVNSFGPLNAIACSNGLPRRSDTCVAHNDARAAGLAIVLSK